jgi:hypothetical protein
MRRLIAAMLLCTAAQAAAYTYQRQYPGYVPPPPATAADLTRAERAAEKARNRLRPPAKRPSGWVHGAPTSR